MASRASQGGGGDAGSPEVHLLFHYSPLPLEAVR